MRMIPVVVFISALSFSPVPAFFLGNNFETDLATRQQIDLTTRQIDLATRQIDLATRQPPFVCPPTPSRLPPLNATCQNDRDCIPATPGSPQLPAQLCCSLGRRRFCMPGVRTHKPLLGVARYCPTTEHLHEFLPVKNCTRDLECEPRICCPDGRQSYCRTPVPRLQPRESPTVQAIRKLVSYLQCSPPPPPFLDLFPKACKYSFDCFPNICCQEKGMKVCRPAKRSILRLLASFA